ncbi:MAG: hypothetical protein GXO48_02440 [Chlorobi bacterium]|nr:hypothetical protein [Chlorobiota bacterium]
MKKRTNKKMNKIPAQIGDIKMGMKPLFHEWFDHLYEAIRSGSKQYPYLAELILRQVTHAGLEIEIPSFLSPTDRLMLKRSHISWLPSNKDNYSLSCTLSDAHWDILKKIYMLFADKLTNIHEVKIPVIPYDLRNAVHDNMYNDKRFLEYPNGKTDTYTYTVIYNVFPMYKNKPQPIIGLKFMTKFINIQFHLKGEQSRKTSVLLTFFFKDSIKDVDHEERKIINHYLRKHFALSRDITDFLNISVESMYCSCSDIDAQKTISFSYEVDNEIIWNPKMNFMNLLSFIRLLIDC